MDRASALDRVEAIVETVEQETMPVPVREIWVYGDLPLGLDPIERLSIYLTKDLLVRDDAPEREDEFHDRLGVRGIGKTVRAAWADTHEEYVRTTDSGYVAPEKCLAAHLLPPDQPIHLEVCNTGFEDNVTQRLNGARARDAYEEIIDPRGVCLWIDGQRSSSAFEKLRDGELVFPTLPEALQMLGLDEAEAAEAAAVLRTFRSDQDGTSVRGDVV